NPYKPESLPVPDKFHTDSSASTPKLHLDCSLCFLSLLLDLLHVVTQRATISAVDRHRFLSPFKNQITILGGPHIALKHFGNIFRVVHIGNHVHIERYHLL